VKLTHITGLNQNAILINFQNYEISEYHIILDSKVIDYFILVQIVCESLSSTCIHSQGIPAPDDDHIFHIHIYSPLHDMVHLFPCECFAKFPEKDMISDEIMRKNK